MLYNKLSNIQSIKLKTIYINSNQTITWLHFSNTDLVMLLELIDMQLQAFHIDCWYSDTQQYINLPLNALLREVVNAHKCYMDLWSFGQFHLPAAKI